MVHLEANLWASDLQLTSGQVTALNAVSKPILNLPAEFNANLSPNFSQAGATVNGMLSTLGGNVPTDEAQRY